MNLETANNRILKIESEIENLLNKKEMEEVKAMPSAMKLKLDVVTSSRIENNKFLYYAFNNEKYDSELDLLYKEKEILVTFINKELKRLHKYKEKEELIIYLRENKLEKFTWEQIAIKVQLSKTQCRTIYRLYKNKRSNI